MKAAATVLVTGVVVVAAGLGLWWSSGREEGARRTGAELAPRAEPAPHEASAGTAPSPAPLAAEREAVAAPEPGFRPLRGWDVTLPQPTRVLGRCLDEDLLPIPAARIGRAEGERSTLSRTDGGFELDLEPPLGPSTLKVEAAGFATRFVEALIRAGETTLLGDVILPPGGRLLGRVFGPDGRPCMGAVISVTEPDLRGTLEEARIDGPPTAARLSGLSGPDGRFAIDGVAPAPCRVWASAEGMRHSVSAPIEVRPRIEAEEIELYLEAIRRDDRITGVVLAPDGGRVPGANLVYGERSGASNSSQGGAVDASGRFEIPAKSGYVYDLSVRDAEGRWPESSIRDVAPGTQDLEVWFEEPRWIAVRVGSGNGTAVEEFDLSAVNEDGFLTGARGSSHPGGSARFVAPTEPFSVRVDARGFALSEQGPFDPARPPAELAFQLESEPGVSGRVLADGRALPGARVALFESHAGARIDHKGYPSLVYPRAKDETRTDSDGRFLLRVRRRGTFTVRAEAPGRAASDVGPLELHPGLGLEGLELVLGRGGSLGGRVLVAPGRDPSGVIVALNRGDAQPRTVRSDAEGRFLFEGLMAGPWHLSRGSLEVAPESGGTSFSGAETPTVIPFNCVVEDGERTAMDLDLRDWRPCELQGQLLVNGSPAGDWSVSAWPGASEAMVADPPSTSTADDGRFLLSVQDPGPLRLAFAPPAELGGGGRIDAVTEVAAGLNEWREDFAMGRLSGRTLSPPPPEAQDLFYRSAPGVHPSCWLPIQRDANGRFALPFVPAGPGSIQHLGDAGWTELARTEIPARGERSIELP